MYHVFIIMHCTLISGSQHSAEELDRTLAVPTPATAEFTVTRFSRCELLFIDGFRGAYNRQQLRSTDGDHRWQ